MALGAVLAERMNAPTPDVAVQRVCAYVLAETGQQGPPIELRKILRWLDVPIVYTGERYGEDKSATGNEIASVAYVNNRPSVVISNRQFRLNRGRARFSVAHEVAHLLIMKVAGVRSVEWATKTKSAYNEVERLCDLAASHLLIPREFVAAALRHGGIRSSNIRRMQQLFDVSELALLRAIAESISGGAVVEWRRFSRTDRETLTWRVFRSLGGSLADKNRPWLPTGCSLKHLDLKLGVEALGIDEPLVLERVQTIFGRKRNTHDGVVCMWDGSNRKAETRMLLETAGKKAFVRTDGSLRLITVLGPRGRFNARLFAG